MKPELTGIFKEAISPPQTNAAVRLNPELTYQLVARLNSIDGGPYAYINVPIDMIGDAKVGDEFTLYLERVKK